MNKFETFEYSFVGKKTPEGELEITGYNSPFPRMDLVNKPEVKDIMEAYKQGIFTLDEEKKQIKFKCRFVKEGDTIINKVYFK